MREILFRGKRVDNGEWVYGAYHKQEHCYGDEKVVHCIITTKDVLSNDLGLVYEEVIPETIGQYIGFNDIRGKKVFEGDIIQDKYTDIFEIEFSTNLCCFIAEDKNYWDYICDLVRMKVIGNKWDNPELLK